VDHIGETLRQPAVAHADETIHFRGPGRAWLWVLCTPQLADKLRTEDFSNPPKIVVGERVPGSRDQLRSLYTDKFQAPRITTALEVAEMLKYCDNVYHAVKATFASEIGRTRGRFR